MAKPPRLPRELDPERFVVVEPSALSRKALDGLIEEFVTREGTDYGHREPSFESKLDDVRRQLERGEAIIVFDLKDERANIVPAR